MDTHRLNIGWLSFAVCQLSSSVHLSIWPCMNCDQEPPNLHTGWVSRFLLPFFVHPDENIRLQMLAVQVFTPMTMKPPELRLSTLRCVWNEYDVEAKSFILPFILPDRTAAHKDVCFLHVDEGLICNQPKNDMVVTYSQCCCHYGRGWGPECNTCPPRHSGEPTENISPLSTSPPTGPNTSCVQICSTACVRCTWRPSPTGNRISWRFLLTTTQVKPHVHWSRQRVAGANPVMGPCELASVRHG